MTRPNSTGKKQGEQICDWRATYVHLDVTGPEQWETATTQAVSEYGKLDILVNNAGIIGMEVEGPKNAKIDGTGADL